MSIQTKVTSYELSKALADAGIENRDNLFSWCEDITTGEKYITTVYKPRAMFNIYYRAYLSCELLEFLPSTIEYKNESYMLEICKYPFGYGADYVLFKDGFYYLKEELIGYVEDFESTTSGSPVENLAKLALELNKQGLLGGGE